jgi:hypothetical protein
MVGKVLRGFQDSRFLLFAALIVGMTNIFMSATFLQFNHLGYGEEI